MILTLFIILACSCIVMCVAWVDQLRRGNATIVDTYWTILVTIVGAVVLVIGEGDWQRRVAGGIILGTWGIRLGLHLISRLKEPEDGRYADTRAKRTPASFQRFMFGFLQLQAISVPLFTFPYVLIAHQSRGIDTLVIVALGLFVFSVWQQHRADQQLADFRLQGEGDSNGKGKVCDQGWWARSRHPNYFFEWLISVAIALCAINLDSIGLSIAAIAYPIFTYLLLRYLSGVPITEARALRSRGDAYRDYQQRVPCFFPKLGALPSTAPTTTSQSPSHSHSPPSQSIKQPS